MKILIDVPVEPMALAALQKSGRHSIGWRQPAPLRAARI